MIVLMPIKVVFQALGFGHNYCQNRIKDLVCLIHAKSLFYLLWPRLTQLLSASLTDTLLLEEASEVYSQRGSY